MIPLRKSGRSQNAALSNNRRQALEVRATDERSTGNMEEHEERLRSSGAQPAHLNGARSLRSRVNTEKLHNPPVLLPDEWQGPRGLASDASAAMRRMSSSSTEDWTPEDEALFHAEMEARSQHRPDQGEVERWRQSLIGGEERDMQDMLENGAYAGAPEPTERAVLGKFTQMVGNKPKLADIIHDAIEHYEPYGSMVARIERETGRVSSGQDRSARSLYNATLARQSQWDAER